MAKTCISSTAHAVTAGPEASVPPRDSGADHAPSENVEWARALSVSTQKRSILPSPHETAAVASNISTSDARGYSVGYSVGASERPRSSATHSSRWRTTPAAARLKIATTWAAGLRTIDRRAG